MSVTSSVKGTLTVTPPIPLASLWEFIDGRHGGFTVATTRQRRSSPAWEDVWQLLPPEGCPLDAEGRPTHIETMNLHVDVRRFIITDRLRAFAQLCLDLNHDFDENLRYQEEDLSAGEIEFDDDGEPHWL